MHTEPVVYSIFLIFTGAAIVSTLVLYTRQSLLVAYVLLGIFLGPWGLGFMKDSAVIQQTSDIGILFLLFLLGLNLHPQKLFVMMRKATLVALISSIIFLIVGYGVGWLFNFDKVECCIIGATMMFSSTIIGLKLLPTTILHHRHTGEVMISVLLLQDLIAIVVLLFITAAGSQGLKIRDLFLIIIGLPFLLVIGFVAEKYILIKLLRQFDHVKEYIFLLSIGWCLGMSQIAAMLGLSNEIGAFIAGVALAASPIALYIAESLKPLRDFFLVLFFFSVGAGFNLYDLPNVILPAVVLSALMLAIKPVVFDFLLRRIGEKKAVSWEVGVRLAQASEFSLLVAYLAYHANNSLISETAKSLIQATTMLTFFVSSYWVVLRYPTPLALTEKMRRD